MPYETLNDLPASVREHLPEHGQEIYRAAFNHAWEEYGADEERTHRIAWAAVKRVYHRNIETGGWERRRSPKRSLRDPRASTKRKRVKIDAHQR